MQDEAVLAILTNMDAIVEGHYELSDGKYTNLYIQMSIALQYPDIVSDFGEQLAGVFFDEDISVVVSPAVSGIVIGQETARHLQVRHIFLEKSDDRFVFRRGFKIEEGENALVIDDVINTGNTVREVIRTVKEAGGVVKGIGCVVDRAEKPLKVKPGINSLLALRLPVYSAEGYPECRKKGKKQG